MSLAVYAGCSVRSTFNPSEYKESDYDPQNRSYA
jgi:hypothetical protein